MKTRALLLHSVAVGLATLGGTLIFFFAPPWLRGSMRAVATYDVVAACLLVWYWTEIVRASAPETQVHAGLEDPGRNLAFAIVLIAVAFGLYSAIQILGHGANDVSHQPEAYVLGLGAVAMGWLLIHTVFTFRYARLYYGDWNADERPDRGLIFPGNEDPADLDFAYFSFVVGMTFQVSDVQISSPRIRRVVLLHGVISFAYSTTILALVVNLMSNLLH